MFACTALSCIEKNAKFSLKSVWWKCICMRACAYRRTWFYRSNLQKHDADFIVKLQIFFQLFWVSDHFFYLSGFHWYVCNVINILYTALSISKRSVLLDCTVCECELCKMRLERAFFEKAAANVSKNYCFKEIIEIYLIVFVYFKLQWKNPQPR